MPLCKYIKKLCFKSKQIWKMRTTFIWNSSRLPDAERFTHYFIFTVLAHVCGSFCKFLLLNWIFYCTNLFFKQKVLKDTLSVKNLSVTISVDEMTRHPTKISLLFHRQKGLKEVFHYRVLIWITTQIWTNSLFREKVS